jgi:hypothetical protein
MCGGLVPLYGSLAEMAVWAGTSWPRPRSKPTGLARAARARSSWSPCPEWSRRPPTIAAMQCGTSSGIGTSGPRGRRLARWWGRKLTGTPTRWRGGGVRAAGTAVLDSGGKELLQNRGGEGDVRRYINRKEEARGRLSPERSGSDGEKAPIQRPQVTQWTGLARGA